MHHINPENWVKFLEEMRRITKIGGICLVFEHNPVNPLTQLAVKRCKFDADAVLLNRRKLYELTQKAELSTREHRYDILFFSVAWKVIYSYRKSTFLVTLGRSTLHCSTEELNKSTQIDRVLLHKSNSFSSCSKCVQLHKSPP